MKMYEMKFKVSDYLTICKSFQAETKTEAKAMAKEYITGSFPEWVDEFNKKVTIEEEEN